MCFTAELHQDKSGGLVSNLFIVCFSSEQFVKTILVGRCQVFWCSVCFSAEHFVKTSLVGWCQVFVVSVVKSLSILTEAFCVGGRRGSGDSFYYYSLGDVEVLI